MWPGVWEFITHIDQNFPLLIDTYGFWTYAILLAIITCETGLVVTPFLPGDSLLFIAGASAAAGLLSLPWLFLFFFPCGCFRRLSQLLDRTSHGDTGIEG